MLLSFPFSNNTADKSSAAPRTQSLGLDPLFLLALHDLLLDFMIWLSTQISAHADTFLDYFSQTIFLLP